MPKEYLECGKIVTTHGVRGEVKVQPWCDGPEFLGAVRHLVSGRCRHPSGKGAVRQGSREYERPQAGRTGYPRRGTQLAGPGAVSAACRCQAGPGDYFIQDLIGLRVIDAGDPSVEYGVVEDVSSTGANDVYHIAREGRSTVLIPAIKQVIAGVDLEEGVMHITPLEGLFDED